MDKRVFGAVCLVLIVVALGWFWKQREQWRPSSDAEDGNSKDAISIAPRQEVSLTNVTPPETPAPPDPRGQPRTSAPDDAIPPPAPGVTVEGNVVDAEGHAVGGVVVGASSDKSIARAESSADGHFILTGLTPSGGLILNASKGDLASYPLGPLSLPSEGLKYVTIRVERTGGIRGRVIDHAGNPVARVMVMPESSHSETASAYAKSNALGEFKLDKICPGVYTMRVMRSARDFGASKSFGEVEVLPGQVTSGVELVLDDEGTLSISGRVTDASRTPVHRALITVTDRDIRVVARSDEAGAYQVKGLKEGVYDVLASDPVQGVARNERVKAGSTGIDLVLPGLGAIEGRVIRAATGQAVTDFELAYVREDASKVSPWLVEGLQVIHDERGRFSLTGLESGPGTIVVRAAGYAPTAKFAGNVSGNQTLSGIEIALAEGHRIEGVVTNAEGNPVFGAQIYVGAMTSHPGPRYAAAARTAEDGTFRLAGLTAVDTSITVLGDNYVPRSVSIAPGTTPRVSVVLGQGATLEGSVKQGNEALVGQKIAITYLDIQSVGGRTTTTSADGTFRLAGLPSGKASVYTSLRSSQGANLAIRSHELRVNLEDGKTVTLNIDIPVDDAAIAGVVTRDGKPVRTQLIADIATEDGASEYRTTESNDLGRYRFERVPPGAVSLRIHTTEGAHELRLAYRMFEVTTVAGETTEFNIAVAGGGAVSGTVLSLRSDDVGYVDILRGAGDVTELYQSPGARVGHTEIQRRANTFRIDDLQAGAYTLVAHVFRAPADGQSVDVTTKRQGSCVMQIVDGQECKAEIGLR